MKTGLRGPLMTMPNSTFMVHNPKQLQQVVFNATDKGAGLHHNNRGVVFFEVPKLPHEQRASTDLYERLTQQELEQYVPTLSIPPRFNFVALDGTKLF